jgi:hypothetical protein
VSVHTYFTCPRGARESRGTRGGRDNVRDDRGGGAGDVVSGLADGPRGEDVQGSAGAPSDDPEVRRRRTPLKANCLNVSRLRPGGDRCAPFRQCVHAELPILGL